MSVVVVKGFVRVSERTKPKITTQPPSVGFLIFERMDQIDFATLEEELAKGHPYPK